MGKHLKDLATHVNARYEGIGDLEITGVAAIEDATAGQLTFAVNKQYLIQVYRTGASAIIVPEGCGLEPDKKSLLFHKNPELAFAQIAQLFSNLEKPKPGIAPTANVHLSAEIDDRACVMAHAYIGEYAKIGPQTIVYPGVYVGPEAIVGAHCILYPNSVVMARCTLGHNVILHSGTVIGADGYGFVWDGKKQVKIPQIGTVIIEDDVEIGANCTVDRARMGQTRIDAGTKLDNLVQVGHNVKIGANSMLVSQVGIAGSSTLGKGVQLAGQVGVGGHLEIGDGAQVGGQAGIWKNLPGNRAYSGNPARPHRERLKALAYIYKLPALAQNLKKLVARVDILEQNLKLMKKD